EGAGDTTGPRNASESKLATANVETKLYVPPPNPGAAKQVAALEKEHKVADAALVRALEGTPRAVWFTGGSPKDVERSVRKTMDDAASGRSLPVLVAYNVPFRDCAQYSAGGALDTAAYQAWIDGFASGIRDG